jgi:hypothetical protein
MKTTLLLAIAFLSASLTPACADDTPQSLDINPACADAPFRDFDFWVGTWDVRSPTGQVLGVNRITTEEDGCLLVERWTGASGGTGQSYNYVDRDTGTWRQVWVSAAFTIDYSGGLDSDGAMLLEGRIAYAGNPANNGPFRGRWTLREDGTVKQSFDQYSIQTETWVPWFVGLYSKIEPTE